MSKLAVNGGKPLYEPGQIGCAWPVVASKDVKAVSGVVEGRQWGRLGSDTQTEAFEREFAQYHHAKHCLAVSNGTVAIDAALRALRLEPGEEVVCTPLTFIASASGILMARGVPVFADIDAETYQISAEAVEAAVTPRTRGILAVHYGGYPADMTALKKVARKHGLFIVEDCAHAQGTEWKGKRVGAIGDAGTFSFQSSKSLACGEGGAIVTNKKATWENAYAFHHIGRVPNSAKYDHTQFGSNYRIGEMQSALLRTQLTRHAAQTEARMRNHEWLVDAISDIPGLLPLKPDKRVTRRGHYYFILRYIEEQMKGVPRQRFAEAARAEGLRLGSGYSRPVYHMPAFAEAAFGEKGCPVKCGHYQGEMDYSKVSLPAVERACNKEQLTLPHTQLLKKSNVQKIARVLRKVGENLDELA